MFKIPKLVQKSDDGEKFFNWENNTKKFSVGENFQTLKSSIKNLAMEKIFKSENLI